MNIAFSKIPTIIHRGVRQNLSWNIVPIHGILCYIIIHWTLLYYHINHYSNSVIVLISRAGPALLPLITHYYSWRHIKHPLTCENFERSKVKAEEGVVIVTRTFIQTVLTAGYSGTYIIVKCVTSVSPEFNTVATTRILTSLYPHSLMVRYICHSTLQATTAVL